MTEVVLLTTEGCEFCDHAKTVLQRLRGEFDIELREVRLESEEGTQLAASSRAPFPPVVFLGGRAFSYGRVSERKLRKALA